jgi:DNA-binding MarR family transcriptional regulator
MELTIINLSIQLREFAEYLQKTGNELFAVALKTEGLKDLSITQLRYLELIEGNPGMSPGTLARIFSVRKPTVANQLARLEELGLITRERAGSDKRVFRLIPTERTKGIFEKRREMYGKLAVHVAGRLDAAELAELSRLFGKVIGEKEASHG